MPRPSPRQQALAQRARRDQQRLLRAHPVGPSSHLDPATRQQIDRDRFVALSADFDNHMRSLNTGSCIRCKMRSNINDLRAEMCRKCRSANPNRLFTASNGMDLGQVPSQLSGLTMIEQMLIARVHPVVSVYKIRGQQRAYSGQCLNFVQHVEPFATRLPHAVGRLTSIILLNRDTPQGIAQFQVRSRKILDALVWLKQNHRYYRHIEIDMNEIRSLPVDGDVSNRLLNLSVQSDEEFDQNQATNQIDSSLFPNIPNIDVNQLIVNQLRRGDADGRDFGDWPQLSQNPINEFNTEGYICCAFPTLFPYGEGDITTPRLHKISENEYFKYLMRYHDGRFADDVRFPYFAFNTMARHCT